MFRAITNSVRRICSPKLLLEANQKSNLFARNLCTFSNNENESFSERKEEQREPPVIFNQLTPDFLKQICDMEITINKFRLENIQRCFLKLHRHKFILPEEMTVDQWKYLLSLETRKAQTLYIQAIEQNQSDDKELLENLSTMEENAKLPLTIPPDIYQKVIGDNTRKKVC